MNQELGTKNQDISVATNKTIHMSLCSWILIPYSKEQ